MSVKSALAVTMFLGIPLGKTGLRRNFQYKPDYLMGGYVASFMLFAILLEILVAVTERPRHKVGKECCERMHMRCRKRRVKPQLIHITIYSFVLAGKSEIPMKELGPATPTIPLGKPITSQPAVRVSFCCTGCLLNDPLCFFINF